MSHQRKVSTKAVPSVARAEPAPSRLTKGPSEGLGDDDDPSEDYQPDPTIPGDYFGPPLHGKTHPPDEMDDTKPTLDDEHRHYPHHPNESGTTEFEFDPIAGDAAADLAGDFGSQFLEGATRGEDLSARVFERDDDSDSPRDLLLDEGSRDEDLEPTEAPPAPLRPSRRRKAR